jgi:protein O-mannosyl-transferase
VKKQPAKEQHYRNLAGLAIIIILGIIIYSNSFGCSFHFDDYRSIVTNKMIRDWTDVKAWWNFSSNRPAGTFSFVLNYHFTGLDVRYWHLVNLVIHLINACLVRWLTLLIFSSPVLKESRIGKHKEEIAFLTALLFVSHPLATQSVTYIVQRLSSLVAMFYFLALALYLKARLSDRKTFQFLLFTGSLISAVLAMLTKENAFTLPFAIVLIEMFFLHTKKIPVNFKDIRLILLAAVFLGLLFIIPLKYSFTIFKPILPYEYNGHTLTSLHYLFTQFSVIVKYIQLLFLPVNQNFVYDFPVPDTFFETRTLLSFLLLLSLTLLAVFLFKKHRIISFGIFWFFLTLSIESTFIPITDVIVEHRTYLPSFGFCLVLSTGIFGYLWDKYKGLSWVIMVIMVIFYSYLTFERNKVWKDEISLWNDNIAKAPHIARPITNRGAVYANLQQWDKAIADYTAAIAINPKFAIAYSNRGTAYGNLGQWDRAIADYSAAIGMGSDYARLYFNRGVAYGNLGRWDEAIADYTKAIGIGPNAMIWSNRGLAYGNLGQWDKAITDYSNALRYGPNAKIYNNRGLAYGKSGQWSKATEDYTRAIALDTGFADAYNNRGFAYGILEQWDKAVADYSAAIRMNPAFAKTWCNRGVAYANLGQLDKAIADFTRAIMIDPDYSFAYSNREMARRRIRDKR